MENFDFGQRLRMIGFKEMESYYVKAVGEKRLIVTVCEGCQTFRVKYGNNGSYISIIDPKKNRIPQTGEEFNELFKILKGV